MWDIIANDTTEASSSSSFISACRTPRFRRHMAHGGTGCNSLPRCAASRLHFRFNAASDPWINISSRLRLSRSSFSLPPSFFLSQNCSLSIVSFPSAARPSPLCSRLSHLPSLCIFDRESEPRHLPPLVESIAIYSSLPERRQLFAFALSFRRSINTISLPPPSLSLRS